MPALHHDGLLSLALEVQVAAGEADAQRLADDLGAFVDALTGHLVEEVPMLTHLPPAEARLLRRGQARIWAAAGRLLHDAKEPCTGPLSRCTARVEELLALVRLQARDEEVAFDDPSFAAPFDEGSKR